MIRKRVLQLVIPACIFFLAVAVEGCSVFAPVGKALSSGYENMVSYFNSYYNAKKLFDEAESEIQADALQKRGREPERTPSKIQIPATANQKLNKVIDKCSYLLAFHSTSTLVDDALLLIGKSFYYQGQYEKAERKFAELLAQFSESDLRPETEVWYARALQQQGKHLQALEVGQTFLTTWTTNKYRQLRNSVNVLMGEIALQQKEYDVALQHFESVLEYDDGELRLQALLRIGDISSATGKYEEAAQWYLKAFQETDDLYLLYFTRTQAALALRQRGRLEEALTLFNEGLNDFRMRDYRGSLYLERGRTYHALRDTTEALLDFALVDTGYAKTQWATLASYELGMLYEKVLRDYSNALASYTKASKSSNAAVADTARLKVRSLTRYFDVQKRLWKVDSLLTWSLTYADSLSIDTTERKDSTLRAQRPPSVDSLRTLQFLATLELADIFSSDLGVPDSAVSYFLRAETLCRDSSHLPRIYYMLGLLAQLPQSGTPLSSTEYFEKILSLFPQSPYAQAARKNLGYVTVDIDPAEKLYEEAEQYLDANDYAKALALFEKIEKEHPLSPHAPKSAYARAWVCQEKLHQYDSAATLYKRIRTQYPTSLYADIAKRMILDSSEIVTPLPDTTRQSQKVVRSKGEPEEMSKKQEENQPQPGSQDRGEQKQVPRRQNPKYPEMRKHPVENDNPMPPDEEKESP